MDDSFCVEKLLELVFVKRFKITPEMTEPGSSYPAGLLANCFPETLHHVMFARNLVDTAKWINEFDSYTKDMLPTQESYLNKIIYACYLNYYCHQKVIEGFISLCSFVSFFCCATLKNQGISYFHLNSIIIMAFFEQSVKKSFLKCGGFQRLLEYIRDHRYHTWNWSLKEIVVRQDLSDCLDATIQKNIDKEIKMENDTWKSLNISQSAIQESTNCITQKVLSILSVDLFSSPDCQDSNRKVGITGQQDESKTVEKETQIQANPKPSKKVSKRRSLKKRLKAKTTLQVDLKPLKEVSEDSSLKRTVNEKAQLQEDLKLLKNVPQENALKKTVDEKTQVQADLTILKETSQGSSLENTVEEKTNMQADLKLLKEVSQGSSLKKTVDEKTHIQADLKLLEEVPQESSLKRTVDEKTQIQADLKLLKEVSQENSLKKTVDEKTQIQAYLTILKETSQGSSLKKTVEEKTKMKADLQPVKEVSQGSLHSDSTKTYVAKQEEDKAWYHCIAEAVLRHNQWETSSFETIDTATLKRAAKIQERMKDSIKSLITVLNEYGK